MRIFLVILAKVIAFIIFALIFSTWSPHEQIIGSIFALGFWLYYYIEKTKKEIFLNIEDFQTYSCEFTRNVFDPSHVKKESELFLAVVKDTIFQNGSDFDLKANADIPFVPQVGQSISCLKKDESNLFTGKILEVHWNHGKFNCLVEPFYMQEGNNKMRIIAAHEKSGWEISDWSFELKAEYKKWKDTQANSDY